MRANGYKCYQTKCVACEGNVCREQFDIALGCDARLVKPETRADRIRAMSNGELAEFIVGILIEKLILRLKDEGLVLTESKERELQRQLLLTVTQWLKEPAKDGEDDGN